MNPSSLRIVAIGMVWAATLAAAYLLGGGARTKGTAAREPGPVASESAAPWTGPSGGGKSREPGPEAAVRPVGDGDPPGVDTILFQARTHAVKGGGHPVAMRGLLESIDQLDAEQMPLAARRLAKSFDGQNRAAQRLALTALLSRWASLDGEAAANFVMKEMARDPAGVSSLSFVLEAWATNDSDQAWTWLQAQGGPGGELLGGVPRESALFLAGLLKEVAVRRPTEAFQLLQDVPDPADRQIILGNILIHTETDVERSAWLARIETLPKEDAVQARDHLIRHLLTVDPESAANWISHMNDPADRARYTRMLGGEPDSP